MLDHTNQLVLLAGIEVWLKFIFVVVFLLIWVFNNLLSNKKPAARPQPRGPAPPPQPGLPAERPAGPQQLAGEIEEFLERATQKRQEKSRRKPAKTVVTAAAPVPPPKPARRLVQSTSENQGFEVTTGEAVAEHVRKHLDNRQFTERAEHLTDDITKSDTQREAHHKQVFEHKLGRLADTSTSQHAQDASDSAASQQATHDASAAAATPIASMLANPESLRQAIVLNEILMRPEHRW